jgi:parvulin-like peptidyl-prolyl isomerase
LITHGGKDQKNLNKLREAAREQFDKQVIDGVKKANKFKTDAEVKHYFNEMGVSLASVRRQWERNFMEFEFLRSRIFPLLETRINHQAIVEYYDRHPEEFQVTDNVKWLDLFVSYAKHGSREEARAHAESLLDQARKGGDFVKMVKQYDDGDSSLRNGEGVGAKRGEINPVEAETVLFKLDDGQVGDIIELPTGCHIVKMVHHQLAGQLPFDEKVQKQIRDKLRNQFYEREKKQIITELRRNAVVEYARSVN